MMLEFGVRNGDIKRIKAINFITKDNLTYLSYTPHKTELSSGRRVFWPIHPSIWTKMNQLGIPWNLNINRTDTKSKDGCEIFRTLTIYDETFKLLNKKIRALGFHGSKASYELRKICIDHVYQKYGAEMATSISGDDIRTIIRYYADPSQPNIGVIRISELL
jgi:hypothetical protein